MLLSDDIQNLSCEFSNIDSEELRSRVELLAKHERNITTILIEHLVEIEKRRSYFDWGFNSLFDYLTRELGYSESAAYRRIQAARAMMDIPELRHHLSDGSLKLSQIAEVQTSIRMEERCTNDPIDLERKRSLFEEVLHKTKDETRKILNKELPTHVPYNRPAERLLHDDSVQLHVHLEKKTFNKLKRVRDLYSHIEPRGPWPRVLDLMADDVIQKRDPGKKTTTMETTDPERLTGRRLRAYVFLRDEGKCQHQNPNGSICGSTFQIEVDHIQPKFAGGEEKASNLRLLCRAHNLQRYRFGSGIRSKT